MWTIELAALIRLNSHRSHFHACAVSAAASITYSDDFLIIAFADFWENGWGSWVGILLKAPSARVFLCLPFAQSTSSGPSTQSPLHVPACSRRCNRIAEPARLHRPRQLRLTALSKEGRPISPPYQTVDHDGTGNFANVSATRISTSETGILKC